MQQIPCRHPGNSRKKNRESCKSQQWTRFDRIRTYDEYQRTLLFSLLLLLLWLSFFFAFVFFWLLTAGSVGTCSLELPAVEWLRRSEHFWSKVEQRKVAKRNAEMTRGHERRKEERGEEKSRIEQRTWEEKR